MQCRAFIQLGSYFCPKMINFFRNRQRLIFPADLCQFTRGCIQYQINEPPIPHPCPMHGARPLFLPNCSRYSTFIERQSRGKVGETTIFNLFLRVNRFPVACPVQARKSRIIIPADCSQYIKHCETTKFASLPHLIKLPIIVIQTIL